MTDPDGRLHTVDNVTVVNGGVLPFPGLVNPTLTIQAFALRAAERLLARAFDLAPPVPSRVGSPLAVDLPGADLVEDPAVRGELAAPSARLRRRP